MGEKIKMSCAMIKRTTVGSLKFFFDASHVIEKFLWILMAILGTVLMSIFVKYQVESWGLNPIISSREWIDLSKVDFPAITFCHQGNTRMAIADRLMQVADEKSSKMRKIRSLFLRNSVEYMMKMLRDRYSQNSREISGLYSYYCSASSSGNQCQNCICSTYNFLFGYATDHNLTVEQTYEKIFLDLMIEDEISNGLKNVGFKMENGSGSYNISNFLTSTSKQWEFLERADTLLRVIPNKSLKMPINFDRSIMEQLQRKGMTFLFNTQWKQDDVDELYKIFSPLDSELNLLAISDFYTTNGFTQLGKSNPFLYWERLYLGGIPKEFHDCFINMHNEYHGDGDINEQQSFEETEIKTSFLKPSPCLNISDNHTCQKYCQWHNSFFNWNVINKMEFLSLMKYSLPQRKLVLPPITEAERNLTEAVFDSLSVEGNLNKNITNIFAPMPLVVFCKDKTDQKWLGDDIGMNAKFCSDFYSTPTDDGLCLTKNMVGLDSLMGVSEEFNQVFEQTTGQFTSKIEGGHENKATFIINTNSKHPTTKTFSRSGRTPESLEIFSEYNKVANGRTKELKTVYLQIHPPNELPLMRRESNYGKGGKAIALKSGYEYTIQVTPFGQSVTSEFVKMDQDIRECLMPSELPASTMLKVYNKENCKYECMVNYAMNQCACIPWDFPLSTNATVMECDVFGRTCFFDVMKQFPKMGSNLCQQCLEPCQFIEYRKDKLEEVEFNLEKLYSWDRSQDGPCTPKDICEYLLDANDTIEQKTWYEELADEDIGKQSKPKFKYATKLLADHIIVHINFASSSVEMNKLDARYSVYTKIANLGGSLGLYVQITGASILTMLHLVVLIAKACANFKLNPK